MAEGLVLKEQRRLVRRELIYYLKVSLKSDGSELGRMGDIHTEGMLILTNEPLAPGQVYEVLLELPKTMQTEKITSLPLSLEVLWSRSGPPAATFLENGVRFLEIAEDQSNMLEMLSNYYAMPGG